LPGAGDRRSRRGKDTKVNEGSGQLGNGKGGFGSAGRLNAVGGGDSTHLLDGQNSGVRGEQCLMGENQWRSSLAPERAILGNARGGKWRERKPLRGSLSPSAEGLESHSAVSRQTLKIVQGEL